MAVINSLMNVFKGKNEERLTVTKRNLYTDVIRCHGGLPVGVEGTVALLLENDSSLLAGLFFMKRGTSIIPVGDLDYSLLQKYSPRKLVPKNLSDLKDIILVSGQNYNNFKPYNHDLTVMRPLIAFSDKEIKNKLGLFG